MLIKENIKNIYTLSPMQEGMFFHSFYDSSSLAYFQQTSYRLHGDLNIPFIEKSLNELFKRYDILRTVFVQKGDKGILQVVLKERSVDFSYDDISSREDKEAYLIKYRERDRKNSFDLSRDVLMRVSVFQLDRYEYEFTWSYHHILMDGWCVGILISEFFDIYHSYLENRPCQLAPVIPYRTYIQWLEKQDKEQSKNYWKKYLEDYEQAAVFPGKKTSKNNGKEYRIKHVVIGLDPADTLRLSRMAGRNRVTVNTVTQSVWGYILGEYSGRQDVIFGGVVSGRPPGINRVETMVGLFINTIPIRIRWDSETTFSTLLKKVQKEALESEPHHYYPLSEIQSLSKPKQHLIDHIIIFQNYPVAKQIEGAARKGKNAAFRVSNIEFFEQTNYDFNLIIGVGDRLTIKFEYNANIYEREWLERTSKYFERILKQILTDEELYIRQLTLLSGEEKKELIVVFNDTEKEYPEDKTIYQLFENQVDRLPDHVALVFKDTVVTFRQLDESANRLANFLSQEKGIGPDQGVAVLMERCVELIVTLMGVMKSGAAYVPLDPSLPKERLRLVLNDASIGVTISQEKFNRTLTRLQAECSRFHSLLSMDDPGNEIEKYPTTPPGITGSDHPAYVMYTSGSSGTPKGVLVEHRTIVNTLIWRKNFYEYRPGHVSLQNPPYFFDSSVTDIFTPLLGGARLVLVCEDERVDLESLKKIIKIHKVSHFIVVPAFYNILVEEIAEYLTGVKMITAAGEYFPDELIRKHFEKLPHVRIFNEYGPTENSVNTTAYELNSNSEKAFIGKPISNVSVYILNRELNLNPIGVSGEICLAGSSLARGYLNRPELTAEKFVISSSNKSNNLSPNDQCPMTNDRLYRTGDLGRWWVDGNLEFSGRIDTQIKIRGMRIEISEIENHLMRHDNIKEVVVLARQDTDSPGGEKYLCAYIVPVSREQGAGDLENLQEYLSRTLPGYMIPSYFIVIDAIPLTSSGKVHRAALPTPIIDTGGNFAAPRDKLENKLVEIWSEVLGKSRVGIADNFFELGGHSLKATVLISRIHKHLNVKIPLVEIFKLPTIRKLSEFIREAAEDNYVAVENTEEKEYYPLAPAQNRLYILQNIDKSNIAYHLPQLIEPDEGADKNRVEETIRKLIERHENLRTSFHMVKDQPVQKVHHKVEFELEYYEKTNDEGPGIEVETVIQDFVRPFDLSRAPLLRVGLIETGEGKCILMVDKHHIISDGISNQVLVRDYMNLYAGETLPVLKLQYKDYSEWINSKIIKGFIKQQEPFWVNTFRGRLPVLHLPTDGVRPVVNRMEGDRIPFELGEQETKGIHALASQHGATLFIVVLAIYTVFLFKLSGQEDIIVGSPIAGRRHNDLEHIIGMFVGTLPMRNYPAASKTFAELLGEVRQRTLEAFENQDYPFENLLEKIDLTKEANRNPLFDVFFQFVTFDFDEETAHPPQPKVEIADAAEQQYRYQVRTSKFDLYLYGEERDGRMVFSLEYSTQLFQQETIEMFSENFKEVAAQILENQDIKLQNIAISHDIYDKKIEIPKSDFAF